MTAMTSFYGWPSQLGWDTGTWHYPCFTDGNAKAQRPSAPYKVTCPLDEGPWPQLRVCFPPKPVSFPPPAREQGRHHWGRGGLRRPSGQWLTQPLLPPALWSGSLLPGWRRKPPAILSAIAPFSPDLFFDLFSVCLFFWRGGRGGGGSAFSESSVFISPSVVWGF